MKKNSVVLISNKSQVSKVKLFHYYSHRHYNLSNIGYFALGSVRVVRASKIIQIKKRTKMKNIIVKTKQWILREDSTKRKYFSNAIVLLKKNFLPLSPYMIGSTVIDIKRKKYVSYFLNVF